MHLALWPHGYDIGLRSRGLWIRISLGLYFLRLLALCMSNLELHWLGAKHFLGCTCLGGTCSDARSDYEPPRYQHNAHVSAEPARRARNAAQMPRDMGDAPVAVC